MKLTTVEEVKTKCPKCSGKGTLYFYQHRDGGLCYRCRGSGEGRTQYVERPLTDSEVLKALEENGVYIEYIEEIREGHPEDWLEHFFRERPDSMPIYRQMLAMI
jgi:hypothetical protein